MSKVQRQKIISLPHMRTCVCLCYCDVALYADVEEILNYYATLGLGFGDGCQ